jgi:hypothetical protein
MVSAPGAEVCNDNASARSSSSSLTLLAVAPGYRGALPGSAGGGLDDGGTGKRNVYLRSISGTLMQMLTLPPSSLHCALLSAAAVVSLKGLLVGFVTPWYWRWRGVEMRLYVRK